MKAPSAFRLLMIALCLLLASLTWGQPPAPAKRAFAQQAAVICESQIEADRKALLEPSATPGTRATELRAGVSVPRRWH